MMTAAAAIRSAVEPLELAEASASASAGLAGLAPLGMEHSGEILDASAASGLTCWAAYFPHLLCTSRAERRVLYERVDGASLVYRLRNDRGQPELALLLPPFPFSKAALRRAGERMEAVNDAHRKTIAWIGEDVALDVARCGYALRLSATEFVYHRAAVAAADGPSFRRLRRNLAAAGRYQDLVARPYAAEDLAPCAGLLRQWRRRLTRAGIIPNGYRYTLRCLDVAAAFPPEQLRGEVAEVGGVVQGFAFGGPISRGWGSVFIAINDHQYSALSYLLRHRMMRAFPDLQFFNDSTDNGRAGLRELKQRFRPVALNTVYRGRG